MGSISKLFTFVSACVVLLAATNAVAKELDVFGKLVWTARGNKDLTYHVGDTMEVPIDFTSTMSGYDLTLVFYDKSDNLLDLRNYSIIYSVQDILKETGTPISNQKFGRANLPINAIGETKLSLREEATGSTQELLTVRVTPRVLDVLKDIALGSREVVASVNFAPGAVLEVPIYYKDKFGDSKLDLILTDKAGKPLNLNDYSLIYSEEGVLGVSVSAEAGHAKLPILKSGRTDITLMEKSTDAVQKVLTVVVYDWLI